jgi:hypothetical protein
MSKPPSNIGNFIAECAIAHSNELPSSQRADLFDALSNILTGEAAKEAELAAFTIRESELHQLSLGQILRAQK